MAEPEKPFICYKSGWSIQISPQTAAGWWMFAGWMSLTLPLGGLLFLFMGKDPTTARTVAGVMGFTLAMLGWAWGMIRWMMARSEVIDLRELQKLKRELDARKGRGRRG